MALATIKLTARPTSVKTIVAMYFQVFSAVHQNNILDSSKINCFGSTEGGGKRWELIPNKFLPSFLLPQKYQTCANEIKNTNKPAGLEIYRRDPVPLTVSPFYDLIKCQLSF